MEFFNIKSYVHDIGEHFRKVKLRYGTKRLEKTGLEIIYNEEIHSLVSKGIKKFPISI